MVKPWYSSKTIIGGIVATLGYLAKPEALDLLAVLPLNERQRSAATSFVLGVGALLSIFGLRRAVPDATLIQTDDGVAALHDPSGLVQGFLDAPRNEHGETESEELERRRKMDAKAEELKQVLEARESRRGGSQ